MIKWLKNMLGNSGAAQAALTQSAVSDDFDAAPAYDHSRYIENCFLTGDHIVDHLGQTTKLDSYMLQPGDAALEQQAYGACYQSALFASPWGRHWAKILTRHAESRGLARLGRRGDWAAYLYPNVPEIELIHDDGLDLHVRLDKPRRAAPGGVLISFGAREATLRIPSREHKDALDAIKARVKRDGACPLLALYEALGLARRLRAPEHVAEDLIRYDAEEEAYWGDLSITAQVDQSVFVPEEAAVFLEER